MKKQHYSYYCNHCREFMSTEVCPIHLTKGILVVDAEDSTYIPPTANPLHNGSGWASMVQDVVNDSYDQLPLQENDYTPNTRIVHGSSESRSEQNFHSNSSVFYYHEEDEVAGEEESPLRIRIVDRSNEYKNKKPAVLRRSLIFVSLLFALLAGSAAGYFLYKYVHDDRSRIFSTAERLYNNGDYPQALEYYQRFQQTYSEDPVLASLAGRIQHLESDFNASGGRISSLMEKAQYAYENGQYLTSRKENAISYLAEVLRYYPNYNAALRLREALLKVLQNQANTSLQAQKYEQSLEIYKSMLQLDSENQQLQIRIEELKEFIASRQMAENPKPKPSTSPPQEQPATDETIAANKTDSLTPSPVQSYAVLPASQKAPIVKENAIDGGKKRYLSRPDAELPKELSLKSSINVIAECIVGTDGFIQEAKIISKLPGPDYAQHALQALMRYRFQPATFNGLPIRFQVLEVLPLK